MRLDVRGDELRSLLEEPSPATVTIHREDGEPLTSPVWFRVQGEVFEFVVAATDKKLEHLRRDPRCLLLIFEATPPFRGLTVRERATLALDTEARVRHAIATKYLGADAAREYADIARRQPGWVVRLPTAPARGWSLADALPGSVSGRHRDRA